MSARPAERTPRRTRVPTTNAAVRGSRRRPPEPEGAALRQRLRTHPGHLGPEHPSAEQHQRGGSATSAQVAATTIATAQAMPRPRVVGNSDSTRPSTPRTTVVALARTARAVRRSAISSPAAASRVRSSSRIARSGTTRSRCLPRRRARTGSRRRRRRHREQCERRSRADAAGRAPTRSKGTTQRLVRGRRSPAGRGDDRRRRRQAPEVGVVDTAAPGRPDCGGTVTCASIPSGSRRRAARPVFTASAVQRPGRLDRRTLIVVSRSLGRLPRPCLTVTRSTEVPGRRRRAVQRGAVDPPVNSTTASSRPRRGAVRQSSRAGAVVAVGKLLAGLRLVRRAPRSTIRSTPRLRITTLTSSARAADDDRLRPRPPTPCKISAVRPRRAICLRT